MWKNTIPWILLKPPRGCNETCQNTRGMLFTVVLGCCL